MIRMAATSYLSLLAVVALLPTPGIPAHASGVLPLTVDLRARDLGPGEPLRVNVRAEEPLESLEGEFLGRAIFFVRDDDSAMSWSGWSMIGLDQQPGLVPIEVRGRSVSGRPVAGTRAVSIIERPFPSETLSVAPKYVEPPPDVRERLARERSKLQTLYLSRRSIRPSGRPFLRPVPGEATSVFGTRRLYNGKPRSPHPGLDLRAATGTPVESSGDGRVGLAQDLYYSGNTVIVDHGGGLFTLYAHLSKLQVIEGEEISAGQVVGLSGATGRVTGPHLHWGAKIGDSPFDPTALLDTRLFGSLEPDQ
jgi:murein DD-endopeptidase MepM/ murein hydrolase activator NlpD